MILLPPEFKRLLSALSAKKANDIDGVTFAECYARRVETEVDGIKMNLISLQDLKTNKRASGRNKDMADLDYLP